MRTWSPARPGSIWQRAGACFGTPLERLLPHERAGGGILPGQGRGPVVREPLEIALCAQHNNGGLAVDCWWQTNVEGFFAVGEVERQPRRVPPRQARR